MPLKQIDHNTPEYHAMVELRRNILRQPLGIDFDAAELAREKDDILLGCFDEERLEGCCLLTREGANGDIRLRQMAVLSGLQGKGIGKVLMRFAENIARDKGFKKIVMHARDNAIGFYEKLGYEKEGDIFMELNIPHCRMSKSLKSKFI